MTDTPRWSKQKKTAFLDTLRKTGNASAAARAAGVDLVGAYEKRDKDKKFAALWTAAEDEALYDLEGELRKRALEGTEKPVFYGGKKCGTIKSFNDNLAMFLLKARRGMVFGDGESGPGGFEGGPARPREALLEKLEAMAARTAKPKPEK